MKTKHISILLFIISGLLFVGYIARLIVDYNTLYQFGSSPFYLYILFRGIELAVPAIILLIIAIVIKKKAKKN